MPPKGEKIKKEDVKIKALVDCFKAALSRDTVKVKAKAAPKKPETGDGELVEVKKTKKTKKTAETKSLKAKEAKEAKAKGKAKAKSGARQVKSKTDTHTH